MEGHIILYNTPDGKQNSLVLPINFNPSYRLPTGAQVIWNTITDGPIRFNDEAQLKNNGLYVYEYYDDQIEVITGQVGMWVKKYGKNAQGQSGTVPYIAGYDTDGANPWNYIPAHWNWLLANYRNPIQIYGFKGWLMGMGGTAYDDALAAVEATYATEPLNKVRWEEKELIPFGGEIYNIVSPFFIVQDNYEIFTYWNYWHEIFFNDENYD